MASDVNGDVLSLIERVEEVLTNGDWPSDDSEDVEVLCHQIRATLEVA